MADVSDSLIEAYDEVRSDKSDTNWLLVGYDTSNKLAYKEKGTGGLSELRDNLEDDKVSYAYARVTYSNDKESKREKFVFVKWIGKECTKVMQKAKSSVHAADLKRTVIKQNSLELEVSEKDELEEEVVVTKLRKNGGANYGPGV